MRRGVSILEVIIAMALLSLLVGMVYSLLFSATREVDGQSAIAALDLEAQTTLDDLGRRVLMGQAPQSFEGPVGDRTHSIQVVRREGNGRTAYEITVTVSKGPLSRTRSTTIAARR